MKRKFVLPSLDAFQQKLEDFFKIKEIQIEEQLKVDKAYMETVYQYHQKGMTIREIAKVTGVSHATVHQWIKKIEKEKQQHA